MVRRSAAHLEERPLAARVPRSPREGLEERLLSDDAGARAREQEPAGRGLRERQRVDVLVVAERRGELRTVRRLLRRIDDDEVEARFLESAQVDERVGVDETH